RTRSRVDLPAPLRPESVILSPGSSLKETSSNSSWPPTWTSKEVAVAIAIESESRAGGLDGDFTPRCDWGRTPRRERTCSRMAGESAFGSDVLAGCIIQACLGVESTI